VSSTWYRLWARVEYDGTDFFGFQFQTDERTVQGEIERALEAVTGRATRVIGAGRTDRGVHARGQVISFEVAWRHALQDLQRAVNAVLAADVTLLAMGQAPEGFHPRFSALARTYRYTVLNQPERSPLDRRRAWQVSQGLDKAQMDRASHRVMGSHDFSSFGRPPQGENALRIVHRAEWKRRDRYLTFDIEANAFLYRMVRTMVGMLVLVGKGQISPDEFEVILKSRDRSLVKLVAPAHGLCLMQVDYPEGVLQ
jgi:tRNA pseudouridine38-40 synthase